MCTNFMALIVVCNYRKENQKYVKTFKYLNDIT